MVRKRSVPTSATDDVSELVDSGWSSRSTDGECVVFCLRSDGTVSTWNETAAAAFGYERSAVIGQDLSTLVASPSDWSGVEAALDGCEDEGHATETVTFRRSDGSEFRADLTVVESAVTDGATTEFTTVIGPPRSAVLDADRTPFPALFDVAPIGIAIHDGTGDLVEVNDTLVEDLGYDRAVLRSMNVADYEVGHTRAELQSIWSEMAAEETRRVEGEHRRADGTSMPVDVHVTKIDHDGSGLFLAVSRDVTERERRMAILEHQQVTLERIQQITESLRPIIRMLARATSREEIETGVCTELANSDAYRFAWYGDYEPVSERVIPTAWAGFEEGYLDVVDVSAGDDASGRGPIGKAIRSRDVQAVRDIESDPSFEPWREEALARGYRSAAAIPVINRGRITGVIGVYSARPDAFEEHEQGLLRELGEQIGHAIYGVENERLLHTDSVVELTFQTSCIESVFVELTEEYDCRLEVDTVVPAANDALLCVSPVDGLAPETAVDFLSNDRAIDGARVVNETSSGGTIEYRVHESPITTLLGFGATVRSAVIEDGVETVVGEVAPDADIAKILNGLRASYPDTALVSKRTVDRPVRSSLGVRDALDGALTDRQREVLDLAYREGFFKSPRHTTGEELAESLGITSPTFYLHVRKATQRLLERLDDIGIFD